MFIMMPLDKISLDGNFNKKVMRRVKIVFYLKKVTKPMFLESFFVLILLFAITTEVSVVNVFNNAFFAKSLKDFGYFWINAFYNTEFIIQTMSIVLTFFGFLMVFQILKSFKLRNTHPTKVQPF